MVSTWEEMDAACRPALSDVERTRPGLLRLGPAPAWALQFNPWGNEVPHLFVWDASGSATGMWLGDPDEEAGDALFRASEAIQDAAIHAVHGAWPECPDHPDRHPLELDRSGTAVRWACPVSGRAVARVGKLTLPGGNVSP